MGILIFSDLYYGIGSALLFLVKLWTQRSASRFSNYLESQCLSRIANLPILDSWEGHWGVHWGIFFHNNITSKQHKFFAHSHIKKQPSLTDGIISKSRCKTSNWQESPQPDVSMSATHSSYIYFTIVLSPPRLPSSNDVVPTLYSYSIMIIHHSSDQRNLSWLTLIITRVPN